jgi:release factor glutamine methyltransferase
VTTQSGPETEYWTLRLAHILRAYASEDTPLRVLDLCTGTACIPLLLCDCLPPRTMSALAVDTSPTAVELANENVSRHDFKNSGGNTVRVERLDIFAQHFVHSLKQRIALCEPFDVLTSNPPYVPREEYDKLSHTVRAFEDPLALLGEVPSSIASESTGQCARLTLIYSPTLSTTPGSSAQSAYQTEYDRLGLSFYVRIASLVRHQNLVRPGGHIAVEVGYGQARAVESMFRPFVQQTEIWTDPWGIERVIFARV